MAAAGAGAAASPPRALRGALALGGVEAAADDSALRTRSPSAGPPAASTRRLALGAPPAYTLVTLKALQGAVEGSVILLPEDFPRPYRTQPAERVVPEEVEQEAPAASRSIDGGS